MKCKNYLKIIGNQPLSGVIKVSGSKNAALPIIAASLLYKGKTKLINVPKIKDVTKMLEIYYLCYIIGVSVDLGNALIYDNFRYIEEKRQY